MGKGQCDVAAVLSPLGGEVVTGLAPHLEGVLIAEVDVLVLARVRVVRPPTSRNLGQGKGDKVAPAMSIAFLKMFEEAANALVRIRVGRFVAST